MKFVASTYCFAKDLTEFLEIETNDSRVNNPLILNIDETENPDGLDGMSVAIEEIIKELQSRDEEDIKWYFNFESLFYIDVKILAYKDGDQIFVKASGSPDSDKGRWLGVGWVGDREDFLDGQDLEDTWFAYFDNVDDWEIYIDDDGKDLLSRYPLNGTYRMDDLSIPKPWETLDKAYIRTYEGTERYAKENFVHKVIDILKEFYERVYYKDSPIQQGEFTPWTRNSENEIDDVYGEYFDLDASELELEIWEINILNYYFNNLEVGDYERSRRLNIARVYFEHMDQLATFKETVEAGLNSL